MGYKPDQPIDYSHKFHVGTLGLDCRYCHSFIETSHEANIPSTEKCMNCHDNIEKESKELDKLKASWGTDGDGPPIEWVKVHMLPDYAYFNHSVHLNIGQKLIDLNGDGVWNEGEEYEELGVGIGCVECHGRVDQMEVVEQVEPLSMSWCLDCHRDPYPHLRPISEITNMEWEPSGYWGDREEFIKAHKAVEPSQDCSACHR